MKKAYVKPEIQFESFSMTANIAVGCEKIANSSEYVCGVDYVPGVITLFTNEMTGVCSTPTEDNSADYDFLCYHVSAPSNNVFTS